MKKILSLIICSSLLLPACKESGINDNPGKHQQPTNLSDMPNPLVGTFSSFLLSNGNTYPAIAVPWGMNFWTPQTGKMGDGWGYTYQANKLRGFKQTHQPSPWINDYGAFAIMPVVGELKVTEDDRASWYSHKSETVRPYYYSAYLGDYDATVEISPTERAAMFRITYPESENSYIIIDGFDEGSMVEAIPNKQKVVGYCRNNSGGVPFNFHNYFEVQFDTPFEVFGTWENGTIAEGGTRAENEHVMVILRFNTKRGQEVHAKVASSFISPEQASINLEREIGNRSFQDIKSDARNIWDQQLGRIEVEGGTLEQRRTFYTALYRTMLFPRKFFEIDAENRIMHYSPYNGEVLPGYMFTDNGFWDTFRAVFPFFSLMYQDLNSQIMEGLVNAYLESGWLPEWASPGHRDCMIGSNSASIIADAYIKGIRGYDIETLYEAILKNSANAGPLSSVGRLGAEYYNKLGYIPYDVGVRENVARTLEYAYDDFAVWQLAKALERPDEEIALYQKRANNFRNVFDPSTNFMRGKNEDGNFQEPFNPFKWGDAFTEGNAWHYTWSVFHDPAALASLMGGPESMEAKLDELFSSPPIADHSYYGFQIHEITEMVIANMGQYAHGNQPMQHGIYLYNWVGAPWKAQYRVRNVLDRLYSAQPDGLCGDEDNGQTSAWYVFSAMGFYPVCPAQPEYAIGSPLFDRVTLKLENGKTFTIEGMNNGRENYYIQEAELNGITFDRTWIAHDEIMNGGNLSFTLGESPNKDWGTGPSAAPYSMSLEKGK